MLVPLRNADAPDSGCDHNDHRLHADAPLSGGLCLWVPRRVRYAQSPSLFILLKRGQYHFRVGARENVKLPMDSDAFTKTKRARIPSNSLNQIEVTVHTDFEEHTTTQVNDHDSDNTTNVHVHEKPNVWNLGDDVEHGM